MLTTYFFFLKNDPFSRKLDVFWFTLDARYQVMPKYLDSINELRISINDMKVLLYDKIFENRWLVLSIGYLLL